MKNIYTGLSLALIGGKRIGITTNDYVNSVKVFRRLLEESCHIDESDVCEVDVKEVLETRSAEALVRQMVTHDEEMNEFTFRNVVIWRNMDKVPMQQQKDVLLPLMKELDEYDTNIARCRKSSAVDVAGLTVEKPPLFVVVAMMETESAQPTVYQAVKERFWFTQNLHYSEHLAREYPESGDYAGFIAHLRQDVVPRVHVSPDVERYVYSLVVHCRNHRLCSLSPIRARLSTRTIYSIVQLAVCMVAWQNYGSAELYVTPDYCKIAMRKIAYWLVDWEQDNTFTAPPQPDCSGDLSSRKQLEISMLTGDWYGSEWSYVREYIDSYRTDTDASNYINKVVEDAIRSVHPPI